MKDKELKAFLLVLRQALLMVVSYIEKHYMGDKGGTPFVVGPSTSATPIVPTKNGYQVEVQ